MAEYFDCGCMLGKWKKNSGKCFYTADDLIEVMDRHGIGKALVYGSYSKYGDPQTGNIMLLKAAAGYGRLYPCATAMPHHSGEFPAPDEFMKFLKENNIRAVRIFPAFQGITLYKWLWEDLLSALDKAAVPLIIDLGLTHWSNEVDWDAIYRICESFPRMPVIMIRMGLKTDRYFYALAGKVKNLYIDTSYYLVNNGIERIVETLGPDRLIFSTGMPYYNPEPPLALIRLAAISEEDRKKIAGGNLGALLEGVNFNEC